MNISPEEDIPIDSQDLENEGEDLDSKDLETEEEDLDSKIVPSLSSLSPIKEATLSPTKEAKIISVSDLELQQETTRTWLAISLVLLLAVTLVLLGCYIFWTKDSKESESTKSSKELLTLIWTSEVTLVSGALGYYFASSKGR